MILLALCGYYNRLAESEDSDIAESGYQRSAVTSCLIIDREGDVRNVIDMVQEFESVSKNGKKEI